MLRGSGERASNAAISRKNTSHGEERGAGLGQRDEFAMLPRYFAPPEREGNRAMNSKGSRLLRNLTPAKMRGHSQ
jgi:hypothetical protein